MSEKKPLLWIDSHIAYIKGLKSPTPQQSLLVILHEKPDKTPQDIKKYSAISRAEKASQRAVKARLVASSYIQSEEKAAKAAERKARTHRLILQGALIDIAGLDGRTHGEILGVLLAVAREQNPEKWLTWRERGDAMLATRKDELGKLTE
jgi:hypothetical protein